MSNIKIFRNNKEVPFKSFIFPAGEVSVKIDTNSTSFVAKTGIWAPVEKQTILARLKNSNDILELIMLTDALRRIDNTPINLIIPKVPYAQQDRVCDRGESLSLKVFAGLINNLKFNKVTILDPHSNVCDSVFDNLEIISQLDIINKSPELIKELLGGILIAPDSGSVKKIFEIAKFLNREFIRCDKLRDLTNGNIKETIVYCDDLGGRNVTICDDICLGGRTFIELAKVLKTKNVGKIRLFITHGIFNNGFSELIDSGINEIWTTNSFYDGFHSKVKIIELEKIIEL